MQWADYRERLGISFNDESKLNAFRNRFVNFGSLLHSLDYTHTDGCLFFIKIGKEWNTHGSISYQVSQAFSECTSLKEVILNAVALHNSYKVQSTYDHRNKDKKQILAFLKESLSDLNILYDVINDEDGIFIIPKGVSEFDENLVSKPLTWLKDYPEAEKAWIEALRDYTEIADKPSKVADGFRKALEAFFQNFFKSDKSLENLVPDYCSFLKAHNIPKEISDDFRKILDSYTMFNNCYAKHHDKTSANALEYIMYATGNIIRLLITLKNAN